MADLIEKDLSYSVLGALFEVQKELGPGYQEKYYQRALAKEFKRRGLGFMEQVAVPLFYDGESIGRYFIDFVIEGKLVVEIKSADRFYVRDVRQVLSYLKAQDIKLGILASFTRQGLKTKRILRGNR